MAIGEEFSPELAKLAALKVNEDPKRRQADIAYLKEWISKQPHLKARTDDEWLLSFLRGCKFSLEKTKQKIDLFYTYRTLLPEFFGDRDPMRPEINRIYELGGTVPLPKADQLGRNMTLVKAATVNPKDHNVLDMVHVTFMNTDMELLTNPRSVIAGDVVIYDCRGCTLDHLSVFTPTMAKKSLKLYQEGYPLRPQAIHVIYSSSLFEKGFFVMKPFLKKRIVDRIQIHTSLKSLQEAIPKELLPADYGGDLKSSTELAAEFKKVVEGYRHWFLEDANYKTDERKRLGTAKTASNIFGIEGSFRTLELD